MKSKLIVHNYTDLEDYDIIFYIMSVISEGKVSKTKSQEEQYCFATRFKDGTIVESSKRKNTYTFKVVKE